MGFLVAWLAGGSAVGIVVMAFLFAVLSSVGDILQITQGVPFSVINLLMAAILFIVLGERGTGGARDERAVRRRACCRAPILSGTSLLYATLGELVGERAGIVNLGLEGLMLIGAATGFAAASLTGNPYLGVAAAAVAGVAANLHLRLRRDLPPRQPARGGTEPDVLRPRRERPDRPPVRRRARPSACRVWAPSTPWSGSPLPMAVLLWGVLFRTRWGLALRAVGEAPAAAFAAGRRPDRHAVPGAWRSPARSAASAARICRWPSRMTWDEGMTAGRGFIAIALVIFARWNPLWAVVGALVFGGAESLQLQFQARGARCLAVPDEHGSLPSDPAGSDRSGA